MGRWGHKEDGNIGARLTALCRIRAARSRRCWGSPAAAAHNLDLLSWASAVGHFTSRCFAITARSRASDLGTTRCICLREGRASPAAWSGAYSLLHLLPRRFVAAGLGQRGRPSTLQRLALLHDVTLLLLSLWGSCALGTRSLWLVLGLSLAVFAVFAVWVFLVILLALVVVLIA